MFRSLFAIVSTALLCGFVTTARAADDDVKSIITKAIKAHGGDEALSKYKAGQMKNKGKIFLGDNGLDFSQDVSYMLPDKFKESIELDVGGTKIAIVTVMNGDKCSIDANGKEVEITDTIKDALKDAQYLIKTARLTSLLKEKDIELSALGEVKVEGKPAVGVRISRKGHKDINLFFDKETNLLSKLEYNTVDASTGKEVAEERIIQEYQKKDKDGLLSPKKVLVKRDGKKYVEAEVVEAKFLEKIDDNEFQK
jgi:hypothetical protein